MKTQRDMSKQQFQAACARYGFKPQGFLGYYELPIEGHRICVSVHNAGPNRRARLAYLLQELERNEKKVASEKAGAQ